MFDDVWQTIRDRYYDPALHGVDWARLGATLRPLAAQARDEAELYAVLRRLVAALGDAHTRVSAPGERAADARQPAFVGVGVSVREIGGAFVVTRVMRDAVAWRGGVRPGDALVSVDGDTASDLFARRLDEATGVSTATARRERALSRFFDGATGTFALVVFAGNDGRVRPSLSLPRVRQPRAPSLRIERVGGYGIITFTSFTQPIVSELMRALQTKLKHARGLVLDLRDNGGGEAEAMTDLASAFLPADTSLGQFKDRQGRVTAAPQTRRQMLYAAGAIADFRAPLVVLTGARTASAAEIFAAALQANQRARIIGEATCGCVLGIRCPHPLPDGGLLELSETNYQSAAGLPLEGRGVVPDETIVPTRRDLRAARDPALERALAWLKAAR